MYASTGAVGLAAVVLLLPALSACAVANAGPAPQSPSGGQREISIPVNTRTVEKGSIAAILSYSGDIQAQARVDILPRATGRIDHLSVDVGDTVQAGDVVAFTVNYHWKILTPIVGQWLGEPDPDNQGGYRIPMSASIVVKNEPNLSGSSFCTN